MYTLTLADAEQISGPSAGSTDVELSTDSQRKSCAFRFMDLPPDLRLLVYEQSLSGAEDEPRTRENRHAICNGWQICNGSQTCNASPAEILALLRSCKLVYNELVVLLYPGSEYAFHADFLHLQLFPFRRRDPWFLAKITKLTLHESARRNVHRYSTEEMLADVVSSCPNLQELTIRHPFDSNDYWESIPVWSFIKSYGEECPDEQQQQRPPTLEVTAAAMHSSVHGLPWWVNRNWPTENMIVRRLKRESSELPLLIRNNSNTLKTVKLELTTPRYFVMELAKVTLGNWHFKTTTKGEDREWNSEEGYWVTNYHLAWTDEPHVSPER